MRTGLGLSLNDLEYFEKPGLNVMLAHDFYPESHQGGVGIIQNGLRVATNGDLRLEPTPGQWSPVPLPGTRQVDPEIPEVSVRMSFPDESKNRKGFNPIDYPDLHFGYRIKVQPEGEGVRVSVDLEEPLPDSWPERVGFNLELFPGFLFGKTFQLGSTCGIFPRQANGLGDGNLAAGRKLLVAPECERQRMSIEAISGGDLQLLDGRGVHNNGWFVVRSLVEPGATADAIVWDILPHAIPGWLSEPVVQVSQVGYHPAQAKIAVIELDPKDARRPRLVVERAGPEGWEEVLKGSAEPFGRFLRFHYLRFDFSSVRQPGMYRVLYGPIATQPFRIGPDIFARHVWQPTVDTFLPVQMCHLRVVENYRVWHGACHLDDARMAPVNLNHFDGYVQGPSTLTSYQPGEPVPGLNCGGWHDAGDYDLRVESQADTVYGLALAYEQFALNYDNTTVDQASRTVTLLCPDGKPDVLQQVEHGVLSIVGGYRALGRLYRGIIEPSLVQYVHLGDAATNTDNVPSDDDRWVFTEDNPARELSVAAALVAAHRVLAGFDDELSRECLAVAREIWDTVSETDPTQRLALALELALTIDDAGSIEALVEASLTNLDRHGWLIARALPLLDEPVKSKAMDAVAIYADEQRAREGKTPYGVPYEPNIWGAGWGIQRFGVQRYWLHRACPDLFSIEPMLCAVNFVLGCHPGSNTASFVSGVGARSMIPGYGVNRADESYIPGGVGSGTALIRPDYPEMLEWPYLWQQTEYCVGYPTSDYVFLIAAADFVLSL